MDARDKRRLLRKQARERQLHLIRLGFCLAAGTLLALTGLMLLFHARSQTKEHMIYSEQTDPPIETISAPSPTLTSNKASYISVLEQMTKDTPKIQQVLDNSNLYPQELLEMLSKNEEIIDFVLDYPEKCNTPPAKTIGDVPEKGSIPLLIQWDERWGYASYGPSTTIAVSGCGPTCLAMVASGLTADNTITPAVVADYANENGYLDANLDTSWDLMTVGCQNFGISGTLLGLDENVMANTLISGYPIICSMGPGIFTTAGHFIVLTGYQDGAFTVHDPASKVRSSRTYTFSEIRDQIKNMWYFTEN